jgi:integrase
MLRALAKLKHGPEARPGSIPALVKTFRAERLPQYAEATRYDYGLMLDKVEAAMRDIDVDAVVPGDIMDLRNQWRDKSRTANKYHALLSLLMGLAIELRLRTTNPCRDVKKLSEPKRTRLLTDDEFLRIREGALLSKIGHKNPSGTMILCAIDLAYLTAQRMGDIRRLVWRQIQDDVILFTPSKTRSSTGAQVEVPLTDEVEAVLERARMFGKIKGETVIHNLKGRPYSKDGIETAWQRACVRAGVEDAHFHDLRAKALSDGRRQGLSIESLSASATHSSITTTEGYLRGMEVKRSALRLTIPTRKRG